MASRMLTGVPSMAVGTPSVKLITTSSGSRATDGILGVGVDVLDRPVPDVFEEAGLDGAAPHVLVDGVRRLLRHVDRQASLLGERDRLVARHPGVADRRHDRQVRGQRADPDLESHLVVALAGAAVRDHGGVVSPRGGDQMLHDDRPRQR